jgi:hypothetical protein
MHQIIFYMYYTIDRLYCKSLKKIWEAYEGDKEEEKQEASK